MIDLTAGKKYDRVAMTWLDPEEYDRRMADREERLFQKQANQGELCIPMVIRDGMKPVQSMTDGKMYDSKSALRAEYRRADVTEVGNDIPTKKPEPTRDEKRRDREKRRGAIAKALSYHGFGAP